MDELKLDCINIIAGMDRETNLLVVNGLKNSLEKLIFEKKAPYLHAGVKCKLWESEDIVKEVDLLDEDMFQLTGNIVQTLSEKNFEKTLYRIANFILDGYVQYLRDEKPSRKDKNKDLEKLIKTKNKDEALKMWLRFYFRIRSVIDNAMDMVEDEPEDQRYIG